MRDLNIFFKNSVEDLIYLLNKQYPKKPAIELVGNRYRLDHNERMILYRGVFDTLSSVERKKKQIKLSEIHWLIIDGYNVLITLESYLKGKMVFRSLDGFVRDISGLYGNHLFNKFTIRGIELLIDSVIKSIGKYSEAFRGGILLLDYPVSKSGELAKFIRERFEKENMCMDVKVVKNPDAFMIEESNNSQNTVVATSDTVVIDKIDRSFDIPDYLIKNVFHKDILDLNFYIQ